MTVAELIEKLREMPQDAEAFVYSGRTDCDGVATAEPCNIVMVGTSGEAVLSGPSFDRWNSGAIDAKLVSALLALQGR